MRSEPHADQWGCVALTPRVHRSHGIAGPPLRTGAVMAGSRRAATIQAGSPVTVKVLSPVTVNVEK